MNQLSRKEFIRLLVVFSSAAAFGCTYGTKLPATRQGSRNGSAEEEDDDVSPDAGGSSESSGDSGAGDDSGASNEIVDASAGTDASGTPVNACAQNVVINNNNGGITSAHAHEIAIPAADFTSTTDKTYTMNGGHAHNITLTAAQLTQLRAGQTVNVTSTLTNDHTHACTIKCA